MEEKWWHASAVNVYVSSALPWNWRLNLSKNFKRNEYASQKPFIEYKFIEIYDEGQKRNKIIIIIIIQSLSFARYLSNT